MPKPDDHETPQPQSTIDILAKPFAPPTDHEIREGRRVLGAALAEIRHMHPIVTQHAIGFYAAHIAEMADEARAREEQKTL